MASSFSQQSILSSFSSLSCWVVFSGSLQAFKNGWHYLETDREATGWESRNFEKLNAVVNELRHEHVKIWAEDTKRVMEKCLYNKYIFWKVTLLPLAAECDLPITNGAWSHWRLHVPLVQVRSQAFPLSSFWSCTCIWMVGRPGNEDTLSNGYKIGMSWDILLMLS